MNDIKHLFLDLDGTLTDPKEGITKSVQYALERMSVEPPHVDDLEWVIGPPLVDVFAQLLDTTDRQQLQQAVAHYRERYVDGDYFVTENKPYEGIHDTLARLDGQGYGLYLATSKPWSYAGKILERFNMRTYFDHVHGSELDGTRDYKEDLIAYILDQHGLKKEHVLMIGDRHFDINGAKHNGVRSAAVTYGYGSLEELNKAEPDALCHNHRDILKLLGL